MPRTIRMYSKLRGHKSMISRLIFQTSSACSASKNLVLKWFDYGACKSLIDTNMLYYGLKLYMHKYLMPYIIFYKMQTMDAIILNLKVRYLDPVAICESLHAGPKWMKDDDDNCWHLLTQTDISASARMPL